MNSDERQTFLNPNQALGFEIFLFLLSNLTLLYHNYLRSDNGHTYMRINTKLKVEYP